MVTAMPKHKSSRHLSFFWTQIEAYNRENCSNTQTWFKMVASQKKKVHQTANAASATAVAVLDKQAFVTRFHQTVHHSHCLCQLTKTLLLVLGLFVSLSQSVHINSISPSQSFRNGEANSVILDCDFSLDSDDDLVVVKWFLNDDPQHIYQWIQSHDRRTYSSKIKPYVDETFVVSDHQTRHRALRLLNPPVSLSGKYTCSVLSLQNEDSNSTQLVIYQPAKSFEMSAVDGDSNIDGDDDNDDDEGFNITCSVIGVFPEPEIKLYKVGSINGSLDTNEVDPNSTTILSFRSVNDGYYFSTLMAHIVQPPQHHQAAQHNDSTNELSPTRARLALLKQNQNEHSISTRDIAEHYECRLSIPHSNYVEVKRLAIQDGWRTKYRINGTQSTIKQNFFRWILLLLTANMALYIVHPIL